MPPSGMIMLSVMALVRSKSSAATRRVQAYRHAYYLSRHGRLQHNARIRHVAVCHLLKYPTPSRGLGVSGNGKITGHDIYLSQQLLRKAVH